MGNFLCCVRVDEGTVAIKGKNFGKYDSALQPGCYCVPWPCGHTLLGRLSSALQKYQFHFDAKSQDGIFMEVVVSVDFELTQFRQGFITGDPTHLLEACVINVMKDMIIHKTWAELSILGGSMIRQDIDLCTALNDCTEETYGYKVQRLFISDITQIV